MHEEKIRVRALPHAKVAYRAADGALVAWRFVGREHDVLRAVADGDLEIVKADAPSARVASIASSEKGAA